MYYVYLVQSEQDGTFYIGQTQNLEERLERHNSGRSKATRHKRPWRLIAYKTFPTRGQAMVEEKRLKALRNHEAVLKEFGIEN